MAIFHFRVNVLSRGNGDKAVAAAAYRSGTVLRDDRYGELHDYSRKSGVWRCWIASPAGAVDWVGDRGKLWNGIEAKEDTHNRRAKAQLAREVEIALPRELTPEQNYELMRRYVDDQFVARGMVADVAIHERPAADGLTNWHVHILLSLRSVGPDGFGLKERAWNSEEMVEAWREGWETYCNEALAAAGSDARIDRRTLDAQGILRAPTVHMGKEAFHAQERGQEPKRVQPSMLDRSLQPFEQQIRRCGHVRLLMPPEAGQSWSGRMATHTARPEEAELDGDAIGR